MKKNYYVIAKGLSKQQLHEILLDPCIQFTVVELYENSTSAKARIFATEDNAQKLSDKYPEIIVEDEILYATCS